VQDPEAGVATGVGAGVATGVGATGAGVDTGVEGVDGAEMGEVGLEQ